MICLFQKGCLQAFNLGKILRKRYHTLLPKNDVYLSAEMKVISSETERCVMSAQSVLAGLLPPSKDHNLLPIAWQPIPVKVLPRMDDMVRLYYISIRV